MAKGITQEQVNGAVDALIAAGERPTIERVRAHLGTGSPDTVNRMLDVWWRALGPRLAAQQTKVLLPDAPASVAKAATDLWLAALEQARAEADREMKADVVAFTKMRESLALRRQEVETQLEAHVATTAAALQAQQLAETRLQDLQRLVDQQAASLEDLQHRHDQAVAGQAALTEKLDAARAFLAAAQEKATTERVALETAHRAAEDRWLREVDRARQDETKLTTRLQQVERAGEVAAKKAAAQISELTSQLRQQERNDAAKSARLAALEGQLDRVHAQLHDRLATATRKPAAVARKIAKPRRTSA